MPVDSWAGRTWAIKQGRQDADPGDARLGGAHEEGAQSNDDPGGGFQIGHCLSLREYSVTAPGWGPCTVAVLPLPCNLLSVRPDRWYDGAVRDARPQTERVRRLEMKTHKILFYGLAALLGGCVPVLSLQPLFTRQTLVFDEQLLGTWVDDANDSDISWQFSRLESGAADELPDELEGLSEKVYRLNLRDEGEPAGYVCGGSGQARRQTLPGCFRRHIPFGPGRHRRDGLILQRVFLHTGPHFHQSRHGWESVETAADQRRQVAEKLIENRSERRARRGGRRPDYSDCFDPGRFRHSSPGTPPTSASSPTRSSWSARVPSSRCRGPLPGVYEDVLACFGRTEGRRGRPPCLP